MRRARILVVDDQAYVRDFLSEELGQDGYTVAGAGDGESIWRFLEHTKPDLVLLDLCLEGFQGWDLLKGLKQREPELPVLILTAYDTYADDPRASQAAGYVVKSFVGLDRLKHEIAAILEKGSACSPDGCLERLH
jgi:two-component system, response regulator, stage 0 sporulation protein F